MVGCHRTKTSLCMEKSMTEPHFQETLTLIIEGFNSMKSMNMANFIQRKSAAILKVREKQSDLLQRLGIPQTVIEQLDYVVRTGSRDAISRLCSHSTFDASAVFTEIYHKLGEHAKAQEKLDAHQSGRSVAARDECRQTMAKLIDDVKALGSTIPRFNISERIDAGPTGIRSVLMQSKIIAIAVQLESIIREYLHHLRTQKTFRAGGAGASVSSSLRQGIQTAKAKAVKLLSSSGSSSAARATEKNSWHDVVSEATSAGSAAEIKSLLDQFPMTSLKNWTFDELASEEGLSKFVSGLGLECSLAADGADISASSVPLSRQDLRDEHGAVIPLWKIRECIVRLQRRERTVEEEALLKNEIESCLGFWQRHLANLTVGRLYYEQQIKYVRSMLNGGDESMSATDMFVSACVASDNSAAVIWARSSGKLTAIGTMMAQVQHYIQSARKVATSLGCKL